MVVDKSGAVIPAALIVFVPGGPGAASHMIAARFFGTVDLIIFVIRQSPASIRRRRRAGNALVIHVGL